MSSLGPPTLPAPPIATLTPRGVGIYYRRMVRAYSSSDAARAAARAREARVRHVRGRWDR